MNVIVFGASGGIGRQVVHQALERGFVVTAFVRNPASLSDITHPQLRTITGDVFEMGSVQRALVNQEAVISCLGSRTPTQADPVASVGIQHIITAMRAAHCQRLLSISSIGIGNPNEYPWYVRLFVIEGLFKRYAAHQYRDVSAMEQVVRTSDRDWTLVRPTTLINGKRTRRYSASTSGRPVIGWWITKADVADFLVRHVDQTTYVGETVHIGYNWPRRNHNAV
jgi:uncharacterized protein YbjT (DUF2867 family)